MVPVAERAGFESSIRYPMKLAFRRAIYKHNYRVVDRFFPWLVGAKERRQFVHSVGPIVAKCGDPRCPVCRGGSSAKTVRPGNVL